MSDRQLTRAELLRRRRFIRDVERYGPKANTRALELRIQRGVRPRQRAPHGGGRVTR